MRISILMELKLTKTHKYMYMHVLNYNCMVLEDNFIMW